MGSHSLLEGIFLTQESNPSPLHWQDYLPLNHMGSPYFISHIVFKKKKKLYVKSINSKTCRPFKKTINHLRQKSVTLLSQHLFLPLWVPELPEDTTSLTVLIKLAAIAKIFG